MAHQAPLIYLVVGAVSIGIGQSTQARRFTVDSPGTPFLWLRSDMGVTLVGSKVDTWTDQRGGAVFSQATDGSRFTYNAIDANFNNQPSLSGTAAWMQSLASITGGQSNVTLMYIHRPTSVGVSVFLETGTSFTTQDIQLSYARWSTYAGGATGFDRSQQDTDDTINQKQHGVSTIPFGSLATDGPKNFKGGSTRASTVSTNTGTNTTMATKTWSIGARSGGIAPYQGAIVEIVAWPFIVSDADIARLYSEYTLPRYGAQGS